MKIFAAFELTYNSAVKQVKTANDYLEEKEMQRHKERHSELNERVTQNNKSLSLPQTFDANNETSPHLPLHRVLYSQQYGAEENLGW